MSGGTSAPRLLIVCTANQCRSALGEALARRELVARGLDARVGSAGTMAVAGLPATDATLDAAERAGLDLASHLSRPLDADLVAGADLVLGMEARHVTEVVALGGRLDRTFTVPELAALAGRSAEAPVSGDGWAARLAALAEDRDPIRALAAPEVADPTGHGRRRHKATVRELEGHLVRILDALVGDHEVTR